MSHDPEEIRAFVPLADYTAPNGPAVDVLQRFWSRARRVVLRRDDEQAVEDDRLKRASHATIGEVTGHPDCSLLSRELERTLSDWLERGDPPQKVQLIVTPPCEVRGLLDTWARDGGHETLTPPPRATLAARPDDRDDASPEIEGDGLLVVPRLEDWFLRHRHGLARVRALLAALSRGERRCVIGCNSWAWRYLVRSAQADLLLPEPLTFAPFDATRLRLWLSELAEEDDTRAVTFRESRSGDDVLALDEEGETESDFLDSLASRSLGIPWVAWQLWQRSLRTMPADEEDEMEEANGANGKGSGDEAVDGDGPRDEPTSGPSADPSDGDVLWLVRPDEFVLPHGHERTARLVLHALLLHGALEAEELSLVLPVVGESNVLPALVRAGLVETVGARFRCVGAAYPAVFQSLSTAGFSVPEL